MTGIIKLDTRESMEFDVVIVGAGPAGLASACRLRQLCQQHGRELSVCLVEKGSEIGAHILSGAVIEPRALDELFPDWKQQGAPLLTEVRSEEIHFLLNAGRSVRLPHFLLPPALHNKGNYVASLGNLCRWLGEQAESLGVEIFTGFSAAQVLYDDADHVIGIATGDMGRGRDGAEKPGYTPGYRLLGKYTILAEGCRGHLGKQVIAHYDLDRHSSPQHYALGIKELWEIPAANHQAGKIVHGLGWPLGFGQTTGGSFLYHLENNQVAVGLITDLNYRNPWLDPFNEFQRFKHHPLVKQVLGGGKRIAYGARALCKGGYQSLPRCIFPGGVLAGDDAGLLNFLKLKGTHTAMKSGMLAAESIFAKLQQPDATGSEPTLLSGYEENLMHGWLGQELYQSRNCGPAMHKLGTLLGSCYAFVDQALFQGRLPFTLHDKTPDHARLKTAADSVQPDYPKPDNRLSFDRLSSVYLSNTHHEEDQPCHLRLDDPELPLRDNLPRYGEAAQRYCPAGVYEVIEEQGRLRFQINAQNCVHCKTCDIKDPSQNITWVTPEGGGGPNYPNL
ncbi:MAG: electron transfer flavoprotein-ubiquinone oxidoreductase [Pseudomonadales bacterium]|nr:electron transfer flavoprotein-ubiquinone oxidoreductase [Pseudomonadales bacterium]